MTTLNLAGLWHYSPSDSPDFAQTDFDHSGWPNMQIPGNWFLGGLDHHGVVWFRQTFKYEPSEGQYQTLRFEGVDYFADVYLNGERLGSHEGYFEPFTFEVTGKLHTGRNVLAVRVNSPYEEPGLEGWHLRKRLIKGILNHHDCRPGGGWEPQGQSYNTGGIWNSVTLTEHGPVTLEQTLLRAELSPVQPAALNARLLVINRGPRRQATVRVQVVPENFDSHEKYEAELVNVKLDAGTTSVAVTLTTPEVQLWQPWDRGFPHLYRVNLVIEEPEADPLAAHSLTFGFRSVQVDERYNWTINGHPYYLRGSNYIASQWLSEAIFPEVAANPKHPFPPPPSFKPPSPSWFEHDVALFKAANLNTLRVHGHVLPHQFHEACDRAGILVWQDFPFQWGYRDEPEFHAEAERQITAMVNLLYNHPSIIAWCCHNESPWDAPWMANQAGGAYDPTHNRDLDVHLHEHVRGLDPTRHVQKNSGTGDCHTYPGWYAGHWHDYKNPQGSSFITEYGAQGLPIRETLLHVFKQFDDDAGHRRLKTFRAWLDTQPEYANYRRVPSLEETPTELHGAREAWAAWRFHNFQPPENFLEDRVTLGETLDDFIASSLRYQNQLNQYGTECFRRAKAGSKPAGGWATTGIFEFMFVEPWPAITWAVLDYWRNPKASYAVLQRIMQPILPTVDLIPNAPRSSDDPLELSLVIVNDRLEAFNEATCHWRVTEDSGAELAKGEVSLNVPGDDASEALALSVPPLRPGSKKFHLKLESAAGEVLGVNEYNFSTQSIN